MVQLFTPEEEPLVVDAIQAAERQTSGEIRVHVSTSSSEDVVTDAFKTFQRLGMHKTTHRNGVLLFLVPRERKFAIVGDQGIHELVGQHFWDAEKALLAYHFQQGQFCQGVCEVVTKVGEKLKHYFPAVNKDQNELPDTISYDE